MKKSTKWKALAVESELIANDVLSKEFLTEELFHAYSKQALRLKIEAEKIKEPNSAPIYENLKLIESRLRVLNPEHRIQTNFEFFTRKIYHFEGRLEVLKEKLAAFEEASQSLNVYHVKYAAIQKEIVLLEQQLVDAVNQREALLA